MAISGCLRNNKNFPAGISNRLIMLVKKYQVVMIFLVDRTQIPAKPLDFSYQSLSRQLPNCTKKNNDKNFDFVPSIKILIGRQCQKVPLVSTF